MKYLYYAGLAFVAYKILTSGKSPQAGQALRQAMVPSPTWDKRALLEEACHARGGTWVLPQGQYMPEMAPLGECRNLPPSTSKPPPVGSTKNFFTALENLFTANEPYTYANNDPSAQSVPWEDASALSKEECKAKGYAWRQMAPDLYYCDSGAMDVVGY